MFTEAFIIIVRTGKQARFPLVDKYTVIHPAMEYYSILKRKELSSYETTWRKLTCILPSERQSEKATYCNDSNRITFWIRKNYGDSKEVSSCQWRGGGMNQLSRDDF